MQLENSFLRLVETLSKTPGVQAVGRSGENGLPGSGERDIDVYVYCSEIPQLGERSGALEQLGLMNANVRDGGYCGVTDLVLLSGVETHIMYFTVEETVDSVRDILEGKCPDRIDSRYYPTSRLVTLKQMTVLSDTSGFFHSLKRLLESYPEKLARTLTHYHTDKLFDTEELERAAACGDALFYHFALDLALDHFLQALFALNKTLFPGRERTPEYIGQFAVKPERCEERLRDIVRLGGGQDSVGASYAQWKALVGDLAVLSGHNL